MQYLSTQAKDDPLFYIHDEVGYNYRMTNLQAALGAAQLEELDTFIARKHSNYELYQKLFADFPAGKLLGFRQGTWSNQWFYSLELKMDRLTCTLKELIASIQNDGVQTRAVWGLIHEQRPYRQYVAYEIERAPYYSACILNIPCSTQLTKEDISYAAKIIKGCIISRMM